jgi:TnpA family transposase
MKHQMLIAKHLSEIYQFGALCKNTQNPARLREANAAVVDFLRCHRITEFWEEGTVASSDAMSLEVSRHLWNARVDPRRRTRSIGIYTHLLDQWRIIYDQPVVLTQRQVGAAIEGIVRQTTVQVQRLAVDTHGYTDFGMAMSKLLGFDLCPRLKTYASGACMCHRK